MKYRHMNASYRSTEPFEVVLQLDLQLPLVNPGLTIEEWLAAAAAKVSAVVVNPSAFYLSYFVVMDADKP
jgi:hypothetical protein